MDTTMNSTFNSSLDLEVYLCASSVPSQFITVAFIAFYILLSPLFGSVLYIGYTKWRKLNSGNMGHSDIITINMAATESMNLVGLIFKYLDNFHAMTNVAGDAMYHIAARLQAIFLCLVCLEHYLAVVHPVTYLRFKTKTVVTIVTIVVVWVLIVLGEVFVFASFFPKMISGLILNIVSLVVVSFFNTSVLCVLIRPGPGDWGRDRKPVDQSKRAALNIISAILGTLVIRFVAVLVFYVRISLQINSTDDCILMSALLWFKMPSSLVLPLLFLYKERQLPCYKPKNNR